MISLTDQDFTKFQRSIYDAAGITLSSAKKALVSGRLGKRLQPCGLDSFGAYFALLASGNAPAEVQAAVDLLTTNETYFFREPKHFELLRKHASVSKGPQSFRVWSAASSTGEEAYSIAMVLSDCLDASPWEIIGSDIWSRVLERARAGHYPVERTTHIPPAYLRRFCLKGIGEQQGTVLVERSLPSRVKFLQVNLNEPLPQLGTFDVIFLRNVMIYFSGDTKRQVVARLLSLLKPGGYFLIGHSESLHGISEAVRALAPSVYKKL
ncbi:MAG: protein-glutamate O-methyltransferase CheR [Betaproteobacteria bacterium]